MLAGTAVGPVSFSWYCEVFGIWISTSSWSPSQTVRRTKVALQ
jgi:hypothetical protein